MSTSAVTVDSRRALFAAIALSAVSILIFNALPVVMGVASDHLLLTAEQMGLLASAELGGIGLVATSGFWWIRRVSWRKASAAGLLVMAVGNLLSISMNSGVELIALRFLVGLLGEGVVFTIAMATIGDARNPDRAFALSIVGQVGLGMLALWAFPLIALSLGYAGVMGTMVVLALLSLTLLQWLPRGGEKPQPDSSQTLDSDTRAAFTTPLFGLIAIVFWFVGLSGIWAFVERVGLLVGLSQTTVGSLLALGLGAGVLGSLLAAWVGDRYGRLWQPPAAVGGHVLMCLLFTWQLNAPIYAALVLGFTFVWNVGLPYLLGLIADSDTSGRLVVLIVSAQALGNTLGPLAAGAVVEDHGLQAVGMSSAFFCTLSLLFLGLFVSRCRARLGFPMHAPGT